MEEEIFDTNILPSGVVVKVVQPKVKHYFKAVLKAKGDEFLIHKYMFLELVYFNGEKLSEEDLDEIDFSDFQVANDIINVALKGLF